MSNMECSLCQNEIPKYCGNCGVNMKEQTEVQRLSSTRSNCKNCDNLISSDANFCSRCGFKNHNVAGAEKYIQHSDSDDTSSDEENNQDKWEPSFFIDEDIINEKVERELTQRISEDVGKNGSSPAEEMLEIVKKGGIMYAMRILKKRINRSENTTIRFGVTGRSAVGKSSFINLLLNLERGDKNYAETGAGDTTMSLKTYNHPRHPNFTITDMPGFGTAEMPKDEFLDIAGLSKFDYLIVFLDTVFMGDDIWLAKHLIKLKIPFCFVRSKLDLILQDESNPEKAIFDLREKLSKTTAKHDSLREAKLFLISTKRDNFFMGDLTKLIKEITDILPEGKTEVLLFFLPVLNPEVIRMKYESVELRSKYVGLLARIRQLFLVGRFLHKDNEEDEIMRFIRVFNLDENYVKKVPGLKHIFLTSGKLPDRNDKWWDRSTLDLLQSNLQILRDDALTVYRYYTNVSR